MSNGTFIMQFFVLFMYCWLWFFFIKKVLKLIITESLYVLSGLWKIIFFCGRKIPLISSIVTIIDDVINNGKSIIQPIRLLTNNEYKIQGEEETQNSLEELQKFCRSANFQHWEVLSKLSSPDRLIQFIQSKQHISENEGVEYEQYVAQNDYILENPPLVNNAAED